MTWKPAQYSSVSPYLIVGPVADVIDFLKAAFGAEPLRRFERADGSIEHAEVRIDDSVIMMGASAEGWDPVPCHVHVYVPDVDATYAAALAAGGVSVQPPTRKDDPDRRAGVRGPGGVTWWMATQVEPAN